MTPRPRPSSPARVRAAAAWGRLRWTKNAYADEALNGIPAGEVEDGPPLFFDADGNGTPDLLVTKASAVVSAWPQAFRPVIYSNDGTGRFSATDWLPELFINAGAICAADIDGDGDPDLFLGARSIPGRYPEKPRSALLRNDSRPGGALLQRC